MNALRLIFRSLRFHSRANLGVALGAALATTVLTGAMLVGDSVRVGLARMAHARLGETDCALVSPDRLFRADLATRLGGDPATPPAALLLLQGVALAPEGGRRVNGVQVVGVDDAFWALAPEPWRPAPPPPGGCWINETLADRLGGAAAGDAWVLRLRKPGGLPAEMSVAARGTDAVSQRLTVAGVLDARAFGHFSLKTTQIAAPTVFLPREWLAERLAQPGRANVLLLPPTQNYAPAAWQARLDDAWRLDDAGLALREIPGGGVELRSDRVFIPPAVADAARRIEPALQPGVAYFVNRIAANGRATPYSFACAPGAPRMPADTPPGNVLVNDWLAEDLGVAAGDAIAVRYDAVDSGGRLAEHVERFTVAGIVPVADVAAADRSLVPNIPGLSDAANCRDWDPDLPVDLARIREKDEAYWRAYGPLPKLYFTLADAERLWSNKYGAYTALRLAPGAGDAAAFGERLRRAVAARDLGWVVQPARAAALKASREAVDFGGLFIGLSFFLIVSAILLAALLFALNAQRRAAETGTLRALGFRPRHVAALLVGEGLALVLAGALAGTVSAAGYQRIVLAALETRWRDIVRTSGFEAHVAPETLLLGGAAAALAAIAGLAWAVRRQSQATVRDLHADDGCEDGRGGTSNRAVAVGTMLVAAAAAAVAFLPAGQDASAFFAAGAAMLAGTLALVHGALGHVQRTAGRGAPGALRLVVRSAARRRGRSLACVAMMALGVFLVAAVAANRRGPPLNPDDAASGTGGYALWASATLPIVEDLDDPAIRRRLGLGEGLMEGVRFTPLRLREGDDASCLNLNRVATPPLLGVDPEALARRGAFTFAKGSEQGAGAPSWRWLDHDLGPDVVPGIANLGDIAWSLGKQVGDTVDIVDEAGRPFRVKLVAALASSILQGHVMIAESAFVRRFPSIGGNRVFLVDAPSATDRAALADRLSERLEARGLEATSAVDRLMAFSSVENTYLAIFMLLGGLGVLLGSAGLGVVAARNILERRAELALLRAVGFRLRMLRAMVIAEHAALAVVGTGIGALAAAVAVSPALRASPGTVPWSGLAAALGAVLAGSLLWIALAVRAATRGPLLSALRSE